MKGLISCRLYFHLRQYYNLQHERNANKRHTHFFIESFRNMRQKYTSGPCTIQTQVRQTCEFKIFAYAIEALRSGNLLHGHRHYIGYIHHMYLLYNRIYLRSWLTYKNTSYGQLYVFRRPRDLFRSRDISRAFKSEMLSVLPTYTKILTNHAQIQGKLGSTVFLFNSLQFLNFVSICKVLFHKECRRDEAFI